MNMKLKNKLLSAGLTACMVVPMTMPVCANEVNPATNDSQNTTLTYTVTSHYTWTIHSAIDFDKYKEPGRVGIEVRSDENFIEVSENVIPEGTRLRITVNGDGDDHGAFEIRSRKGNGGIKFTYSVVSKVHPTPFNPSDEVLSVPAGENEKTVEMGFVLYNVPFNNANALIAGNYLGHIIYTANIVNA